MARPPGRGRSAGRRPPAADPTRVVPASRVLPTPPRRPAGALQLLRDSPGARPQPRRGGLAARPHEQVARFTRGQTVLCQLSVGPVRPRRQARRWSGGSGTASAVGWRFSRFRVQTRRHEHTWFGSDRWRLKPCSRAAGAAGGTGRRNHLADLGATRPCTLRDMVGKCGSWHVALPAECGPTARSLCKSGPSEASPGPPRQPASGWPRERHAQRNPREFCARDLGSDIAQSSLVSSRISYWGGVSLRLSSSWSSDLM